MKLFVVALLGGLFFGTVQATPTSPSPQTPPKTSQSASVVPVVVQLNERFLSLTPEGIRSIFPIAAGRPDAVFMTRDRKVSIAFEWRRGKLKTNEVKQLLTQFPPLLKRQVPDAQQLKSRLLTFAGRSWAQFVFTTPRQGGELRRELLMTSVKGRLFVITIAGKTKDYKQYATDIQQLMNGMKVTP